MSWRYGSENLLGNAHDAVQFINKNHPDWDVISLSFDGENGTPGSVTLVVYRVEKALPRAPGALVWGTSTTPAQLRALAPDWKANPTPLEWDEVKIVMDSILRVVGDKP